MLKLFVEQLETLLLMVLMDRRNDLALSQGSPLELEEACTRRKRHSCKQRIRVSSGKKKKKERKRACTDTLLCSIDNESLGCSQFHTYCTDKVQIQVLVLAYDLVDNEQPSRASHNNEKKLHQKNLICSASSSHGASLVRFPSFASPLCRKLLGGY